MTIEDSSDLRPPPGGPAGPSAVVDYRTLLSRGEDEVDPATWAGSLPASSGIAPRVRIGRQRWFNLLWLLPIGFLGLLVAVAGAQGLRDMPGIRHFIATYPGTLTSSTASHPGIPWWVELQHFVNAVFMIFIIRSGIQILADHPRLYWTRHSTPGRDWFRIQKPVPEDPLWTAKADSVSLPRHFGLPGLRHSIGLARWWHPGIDMLWLANGTVFYVLVFATGQWHRIVSTTWKVFPAAASVLIQYLSLHWPTESGWTDYNALQLLAYFITVFVAAPLALVTGLGMSPALSTRVKAVSRILSIQVARSLHFLVMTWFVFFIVIHVTLVFTTGFLRNLNHIYADRNDSSWVGFGVFCGVMAVMIVAWVAATSFTLRHPRVVQRVGFALVGSLQRVFQHLDATPGEYTEADISPYFWHNGAFPRTEEYQALFDEGFASWRLKVGGLVDNPVELSLDDLRGLAHHEQITQHFCIQGWSGVAKWGGVSMSTILDLVKPQPEAHWVVFYSLSDGPDGGLYYDAHPIEQMRYHLTMLAYDMNGQPLSYGHGAPLRLRNEVQHGFKQVKCLAGIDFVASFSEVAGGYGGYNATSSSATSTRSDKARMACSLGSLSLARAPSPQLGSRAWSWRCLASSRWNGPSPVITSTPMETGWPSWSVVMPSTSGTARPSRSETGSCPPRVEPADSVRPWIVRSVIGLSHPRTCASSERPRSGMKTRCPRPCAARTVSPRGPGTSSRFMRVD